MPSADSTRQDTERAQQHALVEVFGLLVKGHAALLSRRKPRGSQPVERLRNLLDEFRGLIGRVSVSERERASTNRRIFNDLLIGQAAAFERYRLQQEDKADEFNILNVLNLTYNEVRHSMVLAWLLDRNVRVPGTHAQGALGFRIFLKAFGLPSEYADHKYSVRREVAGDDSIIDVEIACRGQFLIHIENKIWASEDVDQTCREWNDVQRRAAELGLNVTDGSVHALFLTPRGTPSISTHFIPISWSKVIRVLEEFASEAKPAEVKLFAAHYARALRRFIVAQEISEDEHG